MSTYKALRIPYDRSKPVEEVAYNEDNIHSLAELVFQNTDIAPANGTIDVATFRSSRTQLAYDDNGLYTQPNNINSRAMALWAVMSGRHIEDFVVPLVGDYVVIGLNPASGDSEDVSDHIRGLFAELTVSK